MSLFRTILSSLWSEPNGNGSGSGSGSGSAYSRPSEQPQDEDTLSASVDLEDIIDEYDEPSRRSKTTSVLTFSNGGVGALATSLSRFSLNNITNGTRDFETTSFYSALQDGFSLNDEFDITTNKNNSNYNLTNTSRNNQEFLWSDYRERDAMIQPTDFQVSWHDLKYVIKPKSRFGLQRLYELQDKLMSGLSSARKLLTCSLNSSNEYDLKQEHGDDNEAITILQSINGSFKSGQLTAVMGPSGAGKTSLLNFISRRREEGFSGSLLVNEFNHKIRINAIPQSDHLPEYLTVRENLMFASRLKNPNIAHDHEKNVERASDLLGLDECLDTRTRNISGGQQKRLAIAQELLSKPDILILDEPTSGLDSLTCLRTLSVLKDLVKASADKIIDPIAVVLTIHQPQREAFDLFDKVYVMATGGIVIYDGPPGECADYVERYSGLKMPASDYNPASFLIEIASGEFGQEPIDALRSQVEQEFLSQRSSSAGSSSLSGGISTQPASMNEKTTTMSGIKSAGLHGGLDRIMRATSPRVAKSGLYLDPCLVKGSSMNEGHFLLKTRILTKRCWISLIRDQKQMIARILFHILLPFGMTIMMGKEPGQANACPKFSSEYDLQKVMLTDQYTSPDTQKELMLTHENVGTLFISIYSCISANIAAMTLIFTMDMKSSLKEYYNGWYSMNSYLIARMLSNIPLDLTLPTITMALTYWQTGQNTGTGNLADMYRVMITSLALVLGSSAGQCIGMTFGAIYVGHITTALFASQGATLPFVLLSGFVARTKNMSNFVRALSMTSLYKHCLEVIFITRYGFNVCGCDKNTLRPLNVTMTNVPEDLSKFVQFWLSSQDEGPPVGNSTHADDDMFQLIAKQLSLYNTYGIDVRSCNEVVPYQLYDFRLTESDLIGSFLALFTLSAAMALILFLTVKIVVNYRTSL